MQFNVMLSYCSFDLVHFEEGTSERNEQDYHRPDTQLTLSRHCIERRDNVTTTNDS